MPAPTDVAALFNEKKSFNSIFVLLCKHRNETEAALLVRLVVFNFPQSKKKNAKTAILKFFATRTIFLAGASDICKMKCFARKLHKTVGYSQNFLILRSLKVWVT